MAEAEGTRRIKIEVTEPAGEPCDAENAINKLPPDASATKRQVLEEDNKLDGSELVSSQDSYVEDVPTDFFDDFNNTEFLAGLDVVDTWGEDDDGEGFVTGAEISKNVLYADEEIETDVPNELSADLLREHEEPRIEKMRNCLIAGKRTRSRSRDYRPARNVDIGSDRGKIRKYTGESRRDPEKVWRDIQRDKARWEKQRINDRLSIVETGLVPPGTEMDVPDASKLRQKEFTRAPRRHFSRSPSPYYARRRCSRSRSPPTSAKLQRYYSPTLYRRRTRSRSRSPPKPDYPPRSDARRKRPRSRSRSISQDRRYRRTSSERHSSRQGYTRPLEARRQSFLEELDCKLAQKEKDRLLNIQAQLNGDTRGGLPHNATNSHATHGVHYGMMASNSTMGGMAPVAAAQHMHAHAPHVTPAPYGGGAYDQSYFVGSGHNAAPNSYNAGGYSQPTLPYYQQNSQVYPAPQGVGRATSEDPSQKLFNDDSISLSEYLKLTQRSDNTQQVKISHKVKVLNRCRDTVKLISALQQPSGRFYCTVNHARRAACAPEVPIASNSSPLHQPALRFSYTSRRAADVRQPAALNRLLERLAIEGKPVQLPPALMAAQCLEGAASQAAEFECARCESRRRVRRVDVGVQCTPDTLEFGAQVNEDDFLPTARDALQKLIKQQSFASLTPAQILAQLSDSKDHEQSKAEHVERIEARRSAPQDFERRERGMVTPQSSAMGGYSAARHSMMGAGVGPRLQNNAAMGAMPQSRYNPRGRGGSLMNSRIAGPGPTRGPPRPGIRINLAFQNPSGFGNRFGPNSMNNYSMRRFN